MSSGEKNPRLGKVAAKVLELLRRHSSGLTMQQMRQMAGFTDSQEHFNRRVRTLRNYYVLETERRGREHVYILRGPKAASKSGGGQISEKLRAQLIHAAHGRCQMCGRTTTEDHIKLQVDHRVPLSWGGRTEIENLWAICEECNRGKRDHFASFDKSEMRRVLSYESVHERIAQFLRLHMDEPVPSYLIEFIANATEQQEDWRKRLRELRYPVIGLHISVSKKTIHGRVSSFYTLRNWHDLPADHVQLIHKYEKRQKRSS